MFQWLKKLLGGAEPQSRVLEPGTRILHRCGAPAYALKRRVVLSGDMGCRPRSADLEAINGNMAPQPAGFARCPKCGRAPINSFFLEA